MQRVNITPRRMILGYFDSCWRPSALAFAIPLAVAVTVVLAPDRLAVLWRGLLGLVAPSLLGILAAAIWNFVRRHRLKGTINLVMFALSLVTVLPFLLCHWVEGVFGPASLVTGVVILLWLVSPYLIIGALVVSLAAGRVMDDGRPLTALEQCLLMVLAMVILAALTIALGSVRFTAPEVHLRLCH